MSSTGSPDPTTSYSSSTPLTFAIVHGSSSGLARGRWERGPCPRGVSKTVTAVTLEGYVRRLDPGSDRPRSRGGVR